VNSKIDQAILGKVWIPRQTRPTKSFGRAAGGLAAYDMRV